MDGRAPPRREVVIPGDLLDGRGWKPGSGTFNEGGTDLRRRYNGREPTGPWSAAMLRKLKAQLSRWSGVTFRGLKTFRATFAQSAKDNGASIEAVSRAMRHGSTKTTERFYARIRSDDAFREIDRAFERPMVQIRPT